ncbi:hypothetical protein [Mucilaginibacter lacusdianchii]|uniref:hypothetical protein n=1 Tax=Mucilaginibacter lacusdianchii TaxID=2684211 RepID=UPI00131D60D7|nr:hypothetical protein [Mucilaginibacter sp. JXJ CY 39]
MIWTPNLLCESVFACLADAGQLDPNFSFLSAGDLIMSQLQFFNKAATPDIILTNATMLAEKLDNEFINCYPVAYQNGQNSSTSCNAMVQVLINEKNTVADLAQSIAQYYTF